MSTDYKAGKSISYDQLFDGRLNRFGVWEGGARSNAPTDRTADAMRASTGRVLTDGSNFLWAFGNPDGSLRAFSRYFFNGDPRFILEAIERCFDIGIYSEHEPQFWGFSTAQEWHFALAAFHEDNFRGGYDRVPLPRVRIDGVSQPPLPESTVRWLVR